MQCLPASTPFQPLMTCYLTDSTTPEDVHAAKQAGVVGFKLYPAGATTNSSSGVTDLAKCNPAIEAILQAGALFELCSSCQARRPHPYVDAGCVLPQYDLLLLVHGEVTDPAIDFFDREAAFLDRVLKPLLDKHPRLRVVMEHITTKQAAQFVQAAPPNVAATITPQHLLWNRNALFKVHIWLGPAMQQPVGYNLRYLSKQLTGSVAACDLQPQRWCSVCFQRTQGSVFFRYWVPAGWPAAARLLPASAEARGAPAGCAGSSSQRQPPLLPGHRQRTTSNRRQGASLQLKVHLAPHFCPAFEHEPRGS